VVPCFAVGCLGLRRRTWQSAGDDSTARSFIICSPQHAVLGSFLSQRLGVGVQWVKRDACASYVTERWYCGEFIGYWWIILKWMILYG
jgi:hypothetical protein